MSRVQTTSIQEFFTTVKDLCRDNENHWYTPFAGMFCTQEDSLGQWPSLRCRRGTDPSHHRFFNALLARTGFHNSFRI